MSELKAKILVYGDIHLSSKDYGSHVNYPKESLHYFKEITNMVEKENCTHLIGLGDLTYYRFHNLEYRVQVEEELEKQYNLVNGNRYELKGNHDVASYGMTELEYYYQKGIIKKSENLQINNLNLTMIDYGQIETSTVLNEKDKTNVVLCHDFIKFKDTKLPPFGLACMLDDCKKLSGVSHILCGHIHETNQFSGKICGEYSLVTFLGCAPRPAFQKKLNDYVYIVIIEVYDDNVSIRYEKMQLLPIEECFIAEKLDTALIEDNNGTKVNIQDVINNLSQYTIENANIENLILAMDEDPRYKKLALELLKGE